MNTDLVQTQTLRVWDLPTRIFHWLLVFCVISCIISSEVGGEAMAWHFRFGYCIITLLIFRIVWGFVGGYWSRFKQFVYSPLTIMRYVRGQSMLEHDVGHNPLGSLSVWGLLILLGMQVASGLMSDDEIATQGPLVKWVSSQTVSLASNYHTHWGKIIIILLVLLHIGAMLFYLLKKKQNLITPMLKGDKMIEVTQTQSLPASKDQLAQRITALVIFAVIALGVAYVVQRLG
ncbi:MAG: cytochrome b/b6 domain-containing protein [Cytophagales bacterium]|nr:cytochrome b/b6 domain-containing protein [Cytophagales bacterium]